MFASLTFKQVVVKGHSIQEIKFEAFDKDIDSDDFLGRCVSYSKESVVCFTGLAWLQLPPRAMENER